MSFEQFQLSDEVMKALHTLHYKNPTEVQQKVIPQIMKEQDCIVQAKTGSGKTASFAIPLIEQVEWIENKPQVLVLTPTRELAVQVAEEFTAIGRFKRIKAVPLYGKQPFRYQQTELKQKTHIAVGTPGRVLDHIEKGTLNVSKINAVIIDEADEMLNMGFIEQVEAIINAIPERQNTYLFSATFSDEILALGGRYTNKANFIELVKKEEAPKIAHYMLQVEDEKKIDLLQKLLKVENPDQCIIFCRTKDRVDEVHDILYDLQYSVDELHGGMDQATRLLVMNDFKRGDFRYLVATDVAARGIDVENISHVFHYDLPLENEAYVHRTGRTGRAGKEGKAFTFVTPFENDFLARLEEYLGFSFEVTAIPSEEEVQQAEVAFEKKMNEMPKRKVLKVEAVSEGITRLYFNGGKKKKLRAVDFVGTICSIPSISAEDIGIITILDTSTFIEILNGKGHIVLKEMRNKTIKGKQLKVHIAKS